MSNKSKDCYPGPPKSPPFDHPFSPTRRLEMEAPLRFLAECSAEWQEYGAKFKVLSRYKKTTGRVPKLTERKGWRKPTVGKV